MKAPVVELAVTAPSTDSPKRMLTVRPFSPMPTTVLSFAAVVTLLSEPPTELIIGAGATVSITKLALDV